MAEYISREELRKHLKECYDDELFDADMKRAAIGIDVYVENMPAADVQPAKRGEWGKRAYDRLQCSCCGKCEDIATDFCPNCGADMRNE